MSKELKPCPFCGGEAELINIGKVYSKYRVICHTDGCINSAVKVAYLGKEAATAAWNKRVTG